MAIIRLRKQLKMKITDEMDLEVWGLDIIAFIFPS